jgi:hypothetical protein
MRVKQLQKPLLKKKKKKKNSLEYWLDLAATHFGSTKPKALASICFN